MDDYYSPSAPATQDGGGLGGFLGGILGTASQVAQVVRDFKGGEQQNNQAAQQAQLAQAQTSKLVTYALFALAGVVALGGLFFIIKKK
jgi:hypothetical protein